MQDLSREVNRYLTLLRLAVLDVIGVTPAELFAELYWHAGVSPAVSPLPAPAPIPTDFAETRATIQGVIKLLLVRQIITPEELAAATRVGEDS